MNIDSNTREHQPKGFLIREAKPSDNKTLNSYIRETYKSSTHLITRPTEFRQGAWKQRHWISKKLTSPVETCILAVSEEQIIGMLENWTDRRKRVTHCTCFALSVKEDFRRKGVGKALLQHFIAWVKKHPTLERIELHVHSDNQAAITLYETIGFQLEGLRRSAVKYEDGRVVDDHIMAFWP